MSTAQSVPEPESGLLETGEFYVSTYSYGGNLRQYIGVSTEESAPGDYDLITLPLDVTPSNPTVKPPKVRASVSLRQESAACGAHNLR